MKKITVLAAAVAALAATQSTRAAGPKAMVMTQAEAPVVITKYTARYDRSDNATEQGISHRIEYRNRSERRIEALEVGFVEFNIWNEHLDTLIGNDLDAVAVGRAGEGSWLHDPPAGFTFYTGVAYISRVRFEDGEIWTADLNAIAEHLRSLEAAFSVEMLRPKGSDR
jgi:hypothetical protein